MPRLPGDLSGAMHCASKGMAELEVRKLLSHRDEYCEVYVHEVG